jgi:hypothetical protein
LIPQLAFRRTEVASNPKKRLFLIGEVFSKSFKSISNEEAKRVGFPDITQEAKMCVIRRLAQFNRQFLSALIRKAFDRFQTGVCRGIDRIDSLTDL